MKNNILFTDSENKEICTASCGIFVFTFPLMEYLNEEEIFKITSYIISYDWNSLFKNQSWLDCLKKVLPDGATDQGIIKESINIFFKYLKEEMDTLCKEVIIEKSFNKKHGESLPFGQLPVGRKFYFVEDDKKAQGSKTYYHYDEYEGHVCFTHERDIPLGEKVIIEPERIIVYLAISAA